MQRELGFLRAEMEMNRKYIFERPLLIVAGGITASATLKTLVGFEVLPLLFLVLLGFNLWFTYNRLQSNARIISYLQLIYTPGGFSRWIGWEAALKRFRERGSIEPEAPSTSKKQRENQFYGPILIFHLLAVVLLTGFMLAQRRPEPAPALNQSALAIVINLTGVALIAFFILAWCLRPITVRNTIDETYSIWERILPPTEDETAPNPAAEPGGSAAG
jgi:bacteriorhodopsin